MKATRKLLLPSLAAFACAAATAGTVPAPASGAPVPVARWTFDATVAGSSDTYPAEGKGLPAVARGSVSLIDAQFGKGLEFGEDHGGIEIPQSVEDLAPENFTVMFWTRIEPNPTGDYQYFLSSGYGPKGLVIRTFHSSQVDVATRGNWHATGSKPCKLMETDWVQIAYTFDGSRGRLYVDGVLEGEESDPAASEAAMDARPAFGQFTYLGTISTKTDSGSDLSPDAFKSCLYGAMDDFRIYAEALSPEQITAAANK